MMIAGRSSTRRRRRRWPVVGSATLAVAAMLGGIGYLALPSMVNIAAGAPARLSDGISVALPDWGERGSEVLVYQHGQAFTVSFPLTNHGLLPVTVTGIELTDEPRPLVETTGVTAQRDDLPATVAPGETVQVELTARFDNCRYYHERELQFIPSAAISGSTLGRSITIEADLALDLVVQSPMIVSCPDRTLTRDDDVRKAPS